MSYQELLQEQLTHTLTHHKIPSIKVESNLSSNPLIAYDATKLALLIEGRPKPHLVPQILHMISVVPLEWRFLYIGTHNSVAAVNRSFAIQYQQAAGKLDLMVVPEPWEIKNKEHVWRMLTDARFYTDLLPGVEWIMKYESDSIMCSNSKDSLNDWLRFDWAGAPRFVLFIPCNTPWQHNTNTPAEAKPTPSLSMVGSLSAALQPLSVYSTSTAATPTPSLRTSGSVSASLPCLTSRSPAASTPSTLVSRRSTTRRRWGTTCATAGATCPQVCGGTAISARRSLSTDLRSLLSCL